MHESAQPDPARWVPGPVAAVGAGCVFEASISGLYRGPMAIAQGGLGTV